MEKVHGKKGAKKRVLMLASVASMIDQFNMPNLRLLLEMGYEVHVACNFKEGNTCDTRQLHKLQAKLRHMGVYWHQWDCPRNVCSIKKCWQAYRQLWELTGCCRFAWIHCHSPVGGALARLVAHGRRIRVVYTVHGFHFYQGAPLKNWLLYYPAEKLLSYWTDVLVTVNQEDYCLAKRRLHAGSVRHIPGVGIDIIGIDVKKSKEEISKETGGTAFREKYGILQTDLILLSVGELSKRKNHKAVIAAMAKLPRQDVHYVICGQGKLGKSLSRYAKRLGIANRVHMPGFLADVGGAYREADIFVFPSRQEGMPVALMEAMAFGMPCVVSDIRGNRELIDDLDARFSLRHPKQLRDALGYMIEAGQRRDMYGAHNREKIRPYDLRIVQKKMRKIYQELGDGK